jgi:NTE family protein
MAFLSSFLSEPGHPQPLIERLSTFPLLAGIGDSALRRLAADSTWFGLPGGVRLNRDGENDTALFLVVTGCLGVAVESDSRGRQVIAQVVPGEVVGEVTLLTGDEHCAELVALRDTEILRIGPREFETLAARHPKVMFDMMRVMARRLHDTTRQSPQPSRPKTFALVPLQEGLGEEPIAQRIAAALTEMGARVAVVDAAAANQSADWFNTFELAHDAVIYRGDSPGSGWTQHCVRQADRILHFARADWPPPPTTPVRAAKEKVCGLPELLLLHPARRDLRVPRHFALRGVHFETHHHLRDGNREDIRRLARFVAGRAVGLVLGGGGARGFAHIGVAKALIEAGVPFDYLGGASMGAIVAAGLAAEWSIDELTDRMRAVFVTSKPLSDYTLPLIALVRGKKVTQLLRTHFGDKRIEELPKPFFCISSDLTTGHIHEHCTGYIWRALRASAALPGILPPVTLRGHMLVDGGVMNNVPVDLMRKRRIGPLIASDVAGEVDFSVRDSRYGERPIWRLIWQRMRGTPSIFDILMRSGTMGSEAQRRLAREEADFLYEPLLPGMTPLDWKMFDRAIDEGYAHTAHLIEKHGVPLTDTWSDGPAVALRH